MVAAAVLPLIASPPLLARTAGNAAPAYTNRAPASHVIIQGSAGFVIQKASSDVVIAPAIGVGRTIKLDSRLLRRSRPILTGGDHALGQ
ncbi:hypothetical protein A8G00_08925 [Sphingobium sp. SA916]|nr:hypothetical protein A8G00_08925 [Sphingobium sp. SA916]